MTPSLTDLITLHATAVSADQAAAENTTPETLRVALTAHLRHEGACEAYRRAHYPRAGRVVATFGEVYVVSPAGRAVIRIHPRDGADDRKT